MGIEMTSEHTIYEKGRWTFEEEQTYSGTVHGQGFKQLLGKMSGQIRSARGRR